MLYVRLEIEAILKETHPYRHWYALLLKLISVVFLWCVVLRYG